MIQQQVGDGARAADLALAKAIALETDSKMELARQSVAALGQLDVVQQGQSAAMEQAFASFRAARPDLDRVYWLDGNGVLQISVPGDQRTLGTDYSDERVFRRAEGGTTPFVDGGVVDLTTYNGVVVVAQPIHNTSKQLRGVVATNLLLDDLSVPLRTVAADQARQGQTLLISILDDRGHLIATVERERILQPMLRELPGAQAALNGSEATVIGTDVRGRSWLYSAVPVPHVGWAVVVQRPTDSALAVTGSVRNWLIVALVVLAFGGLLLWLALVRRVSQPLSQLALRYASMHGSLRPAPRLPPPPTNRIDEVGTLARALNRLEGDVEMRLAELRTLLDTSSAVIGTLDPGEVAHTVIHEVRRLVDVQAAAVLVPDSNNSLRVLASEGRDEWYDRSIHIAHDASDSPSRWRCAKACRCK